MTKRTSSFSDSDHVAHPIFPLNQPATPPLEGSAVKKLGKKVLIDKTPGDTNIKLSELSSSRTPIDDELSAKTKEVANLTQPVEKQESLIEKVKTRFDSPTSLKMEEIKSFYNDLLHLDNQGKVFTLLSKLYDVVIAYEKDPVAAKFPTAGPEGSLGANGSYFLLDEKGDMKWVFKPENEEMAGLKEGIQKGEAARREHLSSVLDREGIYRIPQTLYIQLGDQVGSVQEFVPSIGSLLVVSTDQDQKDRINDLSREAVQGNLVFNLRCNSTDCHPGNLLVLETGDIAGIDNGYCLSSSEEDWPTFSHIDLPQVQGDWDPKVAAHILSLSDERIREDAHLMASYGIPQKAIDRMINATHLLIKAVKLSQESSSGITPQDIAFIFYHAHEEVWTIDGTHNLELLLTDIVEIKEKFLPPQTEEQFQKLRTEYESKQSNQKLVDILFGTPNYIGTYEGVPLETSIFGRLLIENQG